MGGKGIVPLEGVVLGVEEREGDPDGEVEGVWLGELFGSRLAVGVELG